MANHKSAEKRVRSDEKRRVRKKKYISSMRTAVAAVRKSAFDGEAKEKVIELYKSAQSLLGKAASKGYLHKNTAQRRIARLTAMVKADPKTLTPINVKGKKKKKGSKKKS